MRKRGVVTPLAAEEVEYRRSSIEVASLSALDES